MTNRHSYKELEQRIQELEQLESKHRQAEKKLRVSEELFRTLFETAVDAIFIKDSDLKYKMVNPAMGRHFSKCPKELIGKTNADLFDKKISDQVHMTDHRVLKGETIETFSHRPIDGHIRSLHIIKVPLKNAKNEITGLCGIVRNITELKNAEKEKVKAERHAAEQGQHALVGKIAGKMAHDFNNILGVIMGNTELTLLECKDVKTKETLKLILEQTMRGKNLTRNLVAFAKDQEPKHEFFKISDKIDLVLNLMKKDLTGIALLKEEGQDVPELLADAGMIEHALVNLLQNSIHAISLVQYPRILIRTYRVGNNICFEIEDNGCGIPREHIESIYDPSFTLKGSNDMEGSYESGIKGTGYGMANVKKYIEQHKGCIRVNSKVGSGTKFKISLPVIKKELTPDEKIELKKKPAHFKKKILLVEDEAAISDVQYRILTQAPCSHKVDIADNGQAAMDLLNRNEYDFISLDYVLPKNMNGMDVYHHIRKTNKTIPILFISGNIEFLESIKVLKQNDDNIAHLSKPCRNKDYIDTINGLLERALQHP